METIQHYYNLVEKCISNLGVDPANCRGDQPGQWNLKKGSASVWVDVWKLDNEDYGYLQIMAPICDVPANNQLEFLREVLEINHQLFGSGFTMYKDYIYIKTIRELEGIGEDEAMAMFHRIGGYSDKYDDYFKDKYFGGEGKRP